MGSPPTLQDLPPKQAHFCLGVAYHARADIDHALQQYKILKKLDERLAAELYNVIFSR